MAIDLGSFSFCSALATRLSLVATRFRGCVLLLAMVWSISATAQTEQFYAVFEAHSLPMLLIAADSGDIVDANPAATRFYGYPRDVLRSMRISQINTFDEAQVAEERQLAASQARNYFIFRHALSNGDIRTVEVHSIPSDAFGQRVLWSTIVDISPGRNLEEGLWHYQQRLEELVALRTEELKDSHRQTSVLFGLALVVALLFSASLAALVLRERKSKTSLKQVNSRLAYREALLSSLFDQSGYLIGVLDEKTHLLEVNRRALEVIDAPLEAVVGQRFEDTPWWRDEDKPALRHCLAKGLAGESASCEAVHRLPNGDQFNVLLSVMPVRVGDRAFLSVMGVDITAQLLTTRELAQAVDSLGAAETIAGVGHWIIDLNTGTLEWSEQIYHMLGLPAGHPVSYSEKGFLSYVHPDDREALDKAWTDAVATGGLYEIEHRVVVDGEIRWIHERADLSRSRDGKVVGTALDITQRKLLEHQLSEQGRRLRSILEGSDVGTWEWSIQTGETVFNERWAQIVGYTLDEISPVSIQTWLDFIHPDDAERSTRALEAHFTGHDPVYQCEVRMRHRSGDWVWVLDRGKVFEWSDDGRPLRMAGTHLDITDRKHMELAVKRSQEVLQSAIDTIGEAFVIYDEHDRLLICNQRYRDIYPSVADLMTPGTPFIDIVRKWVERGAPDLRQGEDPEAWIARRMELHRSGQLMIQHTDNDRWVRIIERKTPAGHIVGFRVDITDLIRATEAAEAANIAKSRFLATMSHEIRTPLNGILGMAQLMLIDEQSSVDRYRENARVILQSGQQLLSLLNDVLDLAKVESKALKLEDGIVVPDRLLLESRSLFSSLANDKGLTLSVNWLGAVDDGFVGDPYRLSQALNNLINNAIKFTDQGWVEVVAQVVDCDADGELIKFLVKDSGPGIASEKLAELFKPFSQLDSSTTRKHGGTGLGLAIVSSMAHAMGGDVGVESELGQGSHFWFTVRLLRAPDASVLPRRLEPGRALEESVAHSGLRGNVLVVEDNAINSKIIQAMLKRLNLNCVLAANGAEGVEAYTRGVRDIDLILMDMEMPVLDGCAATRSIRAWETTQSLEPVPIVALTANAFADDRVQCLEAGMDDFLAKPVKVDQLIMVLSRWLSDGARDGSKDIIADKVSEELADPDWSALSELIDQIVPMLSKGRFDAIKQIEKMELLTSATCLQAECGEIAASVRAFRFAEAAERLTLLKETASVRRSPA